MLGILILKDHKPKGQSRIIHCVFFNEEGKGNSVMKTLEWTGWISLQSKGLGRSRRSQKRLLMISSPE